MSEISSSHDAENAELHNCSWLDKVKCLHFVLKRLYNVNTMTWRIPEVWRVAFKSTLAFSLIFLFGSRAEQSDMLEQQMRRYNDASLVAAFSTIHKITFDAALHNGICMNIFSLLVRRESNFVKENLHKLRRHVAINHQSSRSSSKIKTTFTYV